MDTVRKIRDCIKKSNMTQKEISAKLGISEDSMVRYLKGTSQFKLDMLIKLSEILQISLYELLTDIKPNNLTSEEQELLEAYRKAELEDRNAARKLLDLPKLAPMSTPDQLDKSLISENGKEAIG